jgi:hypothetical protein
MKKGILKLNIFICVALSFFLMASRIYADDRTSEDKRGTISVTGVSSGKYHQDQGINTIEEVNT